MNGPIYCDIPPAYEFLRFPKRYKVVYGGRGKGASWSYARSLLIASLLAKERVLCCREIMHSLKESVQKLLAEQIEMLGLSAYFDVQDSIIKNKMGSEFIFAGLLRNVSQIKSSEAITKCWVAEADGVSDLSWDFLTPTIRAEKNGMDSEIWIEFNPQYADDPTYKRFVIDPPADSIVKKINYDQNPYFPKVLRDQMEEDKRRDPAKYRNIWLGEPLGTGRKIWSAYNDTTHVRAIPYEILANCDCYMAMDPHSKYYPFCVWIAVVPKNKRGRWPEDFEKHVYAEWPTVEELGGFYHESRHEKLFSMPYMEFARKVLAKDGIEYGIKINSRLIDPRYAAGAGGSNWSTQTEGVISILSKTENGGLMFSPANIKALDSQRQQILSDMGLPIPNGMVNDFNQPSFSVSPICENLRMSLRNHRLVEKSNNQHGYEKEDEKYKDASDALRICYAGIQEPVKITGGHAFASQFAREW